MRIAINCLSFLKTNYAGIGRYAFNLVKSLSEIDQHNEYSLYVQKGLFNTNRQVPVPPSKNFQIKRDIFNSGIEKTLGSVDIYHSPSPDALDIKNTKIIVTIHDLIYKTYPQAHTQSAIETTDKHIKEIIAKASKIICCSKSTLNDLHKYFNINRNKTCLIYQGVDKEEFYPLRGKELETAKSVVRYKGLQGPFLLFVGTLEPRKNLSHLIRAFAILKSQNKFKGQLAVVGMKGWMSESVAGLIKQCRLENDILFLGFVTNKELCYLYNLAEVFVFPSFYEGFGFPIVEAFSCGAGVVTSNASACSEVAAQCALTVDPNNPQDIAQNIFTMISDQKLKNNLKEKALRRSQDFSFLKTAEETLKVYEEVFKS